MRRATTMLVTCVAALLALGMVMLYSASMTQKGEYYLIAQLGWCVLGVAAGFGTGCMDYHRWKKVSLPLAAVSAILLLLVFVPGVGLKINGASRWIKLGPMHFQPSELAKITIIMALANYADYYHREMRRFSMGLLVPGLGLGLMLGLILAGKDYGTTLLMAAVCGMMLIVAGVRWRFVLPIAVLLAAGMSVAIYKNSVRHDRVEAWLNPEKFKDTIAYQSYQAKVALGAGGIEGLGLGNSRQKLGFVPEHHTDFLFSIIGEELGVGATVGIAAAFVILIICGTYIASHAADLFGMYLASGLTFLIGLQAFINIGVVTSVLPNKGLPLPFISYGGSNLLIMLMCVGMLWSIARDGLETLPQHANPFLTDSLESPAQLT